MYTIANYWTDLESMLIIRYENLYLVLIEKRVVDTLRRLKLLISGVAFRCGTTEFC